MIRRVLLLAAVAIVLAAPCGASTQDELRRQWEGRWVVARTRLSSACDGVYTNNRVQGSEVKSGGGLEGKMRRLSGFLAKRTSANDPQAKSELRQKSQLREFAPGEVGSVHKVKAKGGQVELLVDLADRVLIPRQHGSFTLLREAHCQIELRIEVPKKAVKRGAIAEIERSLEGVVARHDSEASARASVLWNGRGEEAYPADYEGRLRDYGVWRNAEIEGGLEEASAALNQLARTLSPSLAYLQSFVRGADRVQAVLNHQSCEMLVGSAFEDFRQEIRMGETKSTGLAVLGVAAAVATGDETIEPHQLIDEEGFVDGQRAVYALAMLDLLPGCQVATPGEASS